MRGFGIYVTSGIFVLILTTVGFGQMISPMQYSMKDGLPSNNIESIYQDSRGFMWFGTTNGLSIFDGRSFTNFGMRDGLPNVFIRKIFEDKIIPRTMWILAGMSVCRYSNGKFFTFTLQTSGVLDIYQDKQGIVWCGTGHGVLQLDGKNVRLFRPAILDTAVYSITEIGDSVLWFAIDKGIISYSRRTKSCFKFELKNYADGSVRAIEPDAKGNLFVGVGDNYLLQIHDHSIEKIIRQNLPFSILTMDKNGLLWFGRYGGIGRLNLHTNNNKYTPTFYSTANGLSENTIRSLFVDREDNIWIGGRDNGVMKLTDMNIVRFHLNDILMYALSQNLRYACSDLNNHIWVISEKSLKEFWRDSSGTWHTHSNSLKDLSYAGTLFVDQSNRLWVMNTPKSDGYRHIASYTLKIDKIDGHSHLIPEYNSVPWNGYAIVFLLTQKGSIVQGGQGIAYTIIRGQKFVTRFFGAEKGIPTNYIRELFEDRNGNIWMGTFQDGLLRVFIDSANKIYVKQFTSQHGFHAEGVWSIIQDTSGAILVGTTQSGLITIINDSININKVLTVKDGLPSNLIHCMTIDSSGRLWIGTAIGMSYETKPGSRLFVSKRAFLGTGPSCCGTTCDGMIWYVTGSDLFIYDPKQEKQKLIDPPIHINEMKVNGIIQNLEQTLSLAYDQNNFEISFIGISFENERDIKYQYRLLGMESDWVGPTQSISIMYGHLHPGSYRFEVRAIDGNGITSSKPASIAFSISTPYWQTWWFQLLSVFLFLSIAFIWYRLRVGRIKAKEKAAEDFSRTLISQQETERKRIAHELHDGLGQEFIVISNRAKKGLKAAEGEQMKTQLDLIAQSASRALESVREIALDLSPYHLEHFGLTSTVQSMINRLTETSQITVTLNIHNIDASIKKEFQIHIYRIMQEAITNIVKHSQAKHVRVEIIKDVQAIRIVVADNGKGFSVKDSKSGPSSRGGLGLPGLMERAKILGGNCSIESSIGNGTTLTFTFPVYRHVQIDSINIIQEENN